MKLLVFSLLSSEHVPPPPEHFRLPYSFSRVFLPALWLLVGHVSDLQSSFPGMAVIPPLLPWAVADVYKFGCSADFPLDAEKNVLLLPFESVD